MGADYYESDSNKQGDKQADIPCVGIGKNCHIRKAIIDKNARIGDNVSIGMGEIPPDGDYGFYHIVDQIYVITKNAIIPNNTTI